MGPLSPLAAVRLSAMNPRIAGGSTEMRLAAAILGLGVLALPVALTAKGPDLAAAARNFMAALTAEERDQASWPFSAAERHDVHYAPVQLDGLRHGALSDSTYAKGEDVLRSALSPAGHEKVAAIRLLERDVRERETRFLRPFGLRDPGRYFWAFFGEPTDRTPWAFRYEGHHVSIHVTSVPGKPPASTPLFLGAQPRVVPAGSPSAGVAALAEEERLARALHAALDARQLALATLPYAADRGHMLGQVARLAPPSPLGLARREMNGQQQALLDELLEAFVGFWSKPIASARRADIERARDELFFAFVASDVPEHAFYARVSGPELLIEIDNTEGGDHVHAVWHRLGADFGDDLLARHWREEHEMPTIMTRDASCPRS